MPKTTSNQWTWVAIALVAHTNWGTYPVLVRYLQTVSRLPSMSLLALGAAGPLLLFLVLFGHKLRWALFKTPLLWLFALLIVVRAVTNILAARYTLSIYVQLLTQSTPFLVILLSRTFFHDPLPRYTGWAITLCLVGALLMMSGDLGQITADTADTRHDWLGLALALTSSLCLALYMLVARRTATTAHLPLETVLITQLSTVVAVGLCASWLVGEDWSRWGEIGRADWLAFAAMTIGVRLIGNLGQVGALRRIGAPLVSSLMAWRLVSALVLGALILNERLTSVWQLLGAAIVLLTITWYLSRQRPGVP